jgi:Arc/MetJ-type ribon-helix-helix transcriptional regulator
MKSLQVELPDKVHEELDALVRGGWFRNEEEAVRAAVTDFITRKRFDVMESQQRADIAWALSRKGSKA